ncbi:MAG: class I SAM-dependent methyltransferase [Gammaproteobacteria bacterium]|nr:class I SAM-dependent methyltransferase [Gammaproteobacteria bacterium]MCH9764057.1 class I SAM-dependent methyltransferase [Gammaproteobacteria bacterium]
MNLDEQRHRYRALDNWFKTPQGRYLGDAMSMQLSQFNKHLAQDVLLQLGVCGDNVWLSQQALKKNWLATPCLDAPNATFIASPQQIPLERSSVDVVIAPMLLEIFGRYKKPLDEIDRVLSPMGHVIFFGINPLSLWGAALACHGLEALGQARMTLHSPLGLKRIFLNRGYKQKWFETFYYVPPFQREQWIKKSLFLNEMGKMMTIFPAGYYCMVLQKYQLSSFDMIQKTREAPLFLPG